MRDHDLPPGEDQGGQRAAHAAALRVLPGVEDGDVGRPSGGPQPLVGGSTGYSGGVWWIPDNPIMKRHGVADSPQRGRQYLDAAVTYEGPGTSPERRDAFIRNGPKMVDFLERQGMKFVYADGWSDYYDELPGGEPRGRSLLAELFDTRELGEWESRLSRYKGFSLPVPMFPLRELAICGSYVGTLAEARELVALVRRGLTGPIPYDERPLAAVNAALADLREGRIVGRMVLRP